MLIMWKIFFPLYTYATTIKNIVNTVCKKNYVVSNSCFSIELLFEQLNLIVL
jgi:hypothetical protein